MLLSGKMTNQSQRNHEIYKMDYSSKNNPHFLQIMMTAGLN